MTVIARGAAIVAALALAVIHAVLAPEHLEEKPYVGVLFIIGTVLLVIAAAALVVPRVRQIGWWLGAVVSAGMFVAYVLSRTSGLPRGYKEGWGEPLGTGSLVLEVIFVAAAALMIRARSGAGVHSSAVRT